MAQSTLPRGCRARPPPTTSSRTRVMAAPGLPEADFRKALDSALFRRWLESLQAEKGLLAHGKLSLRQILIQGVDMFGQRVGFLKFKADIMDEETQAKIPGIFFARGPAVAVLILLQSKGQTYVVLTEQARVPIGKFILELPAGMLDDENGDFVGTAVREVHKAYTNLAATARNPTSSISCLDLRTLAVLANSTLSSSRLECLLTQSCFKDVSVKLPSSLFDIRSLNYWKDTGSNIYW
ncbi:nudix hydrolase 14, chloroplastic-like isoform X6 [Triticum dicoccoides]|uniref:nudix hydrolase 14, chloroplastic-like isoform X6 n=1 Tax=Triticum dicoccoides TaxID=85692 RepID=UPI00189153EB|nr:nudix hydrolase 14, chloroplastic-like isoform X6 [Triticum dicoccoides]